MKRHLMLLIAVFVTLTAIGEKRASIQEAQEVALQYYQKISDNSKGDYTAGVPESVSLLGIADMWLVPVNDCWVLVSSDKRTEAILARFSSIEKPDFKEAPPAVRCLIGCYENDIAYARDSCKDCPVRNSWIIPLKKETSQSQQDRSYPLYVAPLINSTWRQYKNSSSNPSCEKVYNKFCPEISTTNPDLCGKAVAGCVAIAVGQIMRYWQWPYAANVPTTVGGSTKVKKFYDWSLMPTALNNTTTLTQVNMTAGFIRDLGYDLDMDYGESSGADDDDAEDTFINFGYDPNTITLRHKWNTEGWTNYLRSEIGAGRPVYYAGYDSFWGTGGHAFILDGYDQYDHYHINFGWGGSWDGDYLIDTFTFGEQNGYTYWQSAIWGIKPAANYCTALTVTTPVESPKFCIAQAGAVTISGVNINNITEGKIYSAESVRLTTGTNIRSGCDVQIAIKPIPCSPPTSPSNIIAHHDADQEIENLCREPNRIINLTNEQMDIRSIDQIKTLFIYCMDGQLLFKGNSSILSTESLSDGVYIIRAITEDGAIYQSKILLQR